jgi:GDPmannose 4,6-dehydratase
MKKKNILILGVTGQDGSYLSRYLIEKKNYNIIGVSRRKKVIKNHKLLSIHNKIIIKYFDYNNYIKLEKVIKKYKISEIYFFSGQNIPKISNNSVIETLYSNVIPVYNIIDIILKNNKKIKFFNSSSCEVFKKSNYAMNENSQMSPNSIYGLSKLISFEIVKFFREKFNLKVCSGIMFHHESILRNKDFVLKKIIETAKNIKNKKTQKLYLGDIKISRDWGWAPEYVKLIHKILNKKKVEDFVIATGRTLKLKTLIKQVFDHHGLDWLKYTKTNNSLLRKFDNRTRIADNSKIKKVLNWNPKYTAMDIVNNLLNDKLD